jgi:hypothetical protein
MSSNPHDKRCGRCGADVQEAHLHGKRGEKCLCLVSYYDERMPDAWYFNYETRRALVAD